MKPLQLTYSPFELKFKAPFLTSQKQINKRKGILIKIKYKDFFGFGECSPFPEFGSETFEQAENKLQDFKLKMNLNPNDFITNISESLAELDDFPSLKHGIEQALLNLICYKTKLTINELLNVKSFSSVSVNAVVGFLFPEETLITCKNYLKEGFKTIKLKVGRENFEDDMKIISLIREKLGYDFNLRLDANGKWDFITAKIVFNQLKVFKIEYVEQPLNSINDFIKLKSGSKIPIAADESIRTYKDAVIFIQKKAADVIILKPMMIGGLLQTLKITELCEKYKVKVVITTTFESSLGKSFAVFAASTIKNKIAHGLGTAKYFEKDLFPDLYPVKNGVIKLT
ncbi:MAG: o-succinylbenzoate synthase [Ignavibacteriales bacterium CG12_big_fil_rev_8_21_14_0_65_30_8]|nr:MAG: o-succinylbenzoate synthase [Ignavibacteriales bacterium CG12_big_fil_rev_8_21_14_0_65_30_8]